MQTILVVFGTRPEAIKLAPVIAELKRQPRAFRTVLCTTAQHRQMLDPVLRLFDLKVDIDLDLMRPDQDLSTLTERVCHGMTNVLRKHRPDWLLVQGDTTTVMASALAAFYERIPVAHVEAGLRTYRTDSPYPEEMNRRVVSVIATRHFAPTTIARRHLLSEGIKPSSVQVTGNTGVDAVLSVARRLDKPAVRRRVVAALAKILPAELLQRPSRGTAAAQLILVTGHRRENFGRGLANICVALKAIAAKFPRVHIVYPVHLNPNVRRAVYQTLAGSARERVFLTEPLDYLMFIFLLKQCRLVLTDSGGLQEEAPSFGKPILILRDTTERPEGVASGAAKLVGTGRTRIVREVARLLTDPAAYRRMASAGNPFGDGRASARIVRALRREAGYR